MLDKRLTEQRNPRSARIDFLSPLQITELINSEDQTVAEAVAEEREAIAQVGRGEDGVGGVAEADGAEIETVAQRNDCLRIKLQFNRAAQH